MSIIRQIPWTEQPQEAVGVDWSNPLSAGLISAVIGGQRFDCFGRRITFNSTTTTAPGADGLRTVTNGTTDSAYIDIPTQVLTAWTIWGRTTPTSLALDATLGSLGNTGTSTPTVSLRMGNATSNRLQYWQRADNSGSISAGPRDSGVAVFSAGETLSVSLSVSTPTALLRGFKNGALIEAPSTNIAANSWTVNRIGIGVLYAAGNFSLGAYGSSLLLFFNRELSDSEQASLAANPWQLFAARVQRIWSPAAAAIPTLSAATFLPGSITASGFRPRVTAS
jgi:hypothetical protein